MDNIKVQIVELKGEQDFKTVCELTGANSQNKNGKNGNFIYANFRRLCKNLSIYEKIKINAEDAYAVLFKYTFPSQLKEAWVKANIMDQLRSWFRFKKTRDRVIFEYTNQQSETGCTEYYVALVPVSVNESSANGTVSIDAFFNNTDATKEKFINKYIKFIENAPSKAYVVQHGNSNEKKDANKSNDTNRQTLKREDQMHRSDFHEQHPNRQNKKSEKLNKGNTSSTQKEEVLKNTNPGFAQKPADGQKDIVIEKAKQDIPEGQRSTKPVSSATEGISDFRTSMNKKDKKQQSFSQKQVTKEGRKSKEISSSQNHDIPQSEKYTTADHSTPINDKQSSAQSNTQKSPIATQEAKSSKQESILLQELRTKIADQESIIQEIQKNLDDALEKCHTAEVQYVMTKAALTDFDELRQKYGTPKEIEQRIYKSFLFDKAIQAAQEDHDAETIRNILGYLKTGKEYCTEHNIKILGESNE